MIRDFIERANTENRTDLICPYCLSNNNEDEDGDQYYNICETIIKCLFCEKDFQADIELIPIFTTKTMEEAKEDGDIDE